jgi:hypothetical protein
VEAEMATRMKDVARRSTKKYVEEALYRLLFRQGSTPQVVREEVDGFLDSRKRAFKWGVGVCIRRMRRQELYRPALKVRAFLSHSFRDLLGSRYLTISNVLCSVIDLWDVRAL